MWKLDGNKLKNKANIWTSTDDWRLPEPGVKDNIENTSKNTFLDIFNDDTDSGLAVIQTKVEKYAEKWKKETGVSNVSDKTLAEKYSESTQTLQLWKN